MANESFIPASKAESAQLLKLKGERWHNIPTTAEWLDVSTDTLRCWMGLRKSAIPILTEEIHYRKLNPGAGNSPWVLNIARIEARLRELETTRAPEVEAAKAKRMEHARSFMGKDKTQS